MQPPRSGFLQEQETTVSSGSEPARRPGVPPRQENLTTAINRGFDVLVEQSEEQILWLGAERLSGRWRLPVLNDAFEIDVSERRVITSDGNPVGPQWTILANHYLAITSRPERCEPAITFADIATARSYAGVYDARTVVRLCHTAGRDAETLTAAAASLGGRPATGGDEAFDFDLLPRLSIRLIWHAPDLEFGASATLLLPPNIESYLCTEDTVVLSECLVARLGGRPF